MENKNVLETQRDVVLLAVRVKTKKVMSEAMAKICNEILKPAIETLTGLGLPEEEWSDRLMNNYAESVWDAVNSTCDKIIEEEESK